ncbi:hypothetical protein M9Y10_002696 [Tritrichomonas musculus]|uniref:C2 domain-containing protein n=1 Tax=Tritrichomonas musculus TaxID=1915356 RepID=A0ABR2LAK1_9EUKA
MAARLHIKICEAKKVLKMDLGGKSDPYVTLRLKSQDKKDVQKTQIISNTTDPIWNQEFDIVATDPNDVLLINMFDEDIKNDDKMMDELQFPVNTWPVGGPLDRKELDIKLKKKKAGKFIFEVQAFPAEGYASGVSERAVNLGGSSGTEGCRVHIKAFDAKDVLKMDLGGKSDPYLRFGIKGKKESRVKTQIISNTRNPIWNQELDVVSTNRSADVLEVDMLDEDIKNDDKMMDKIEIPLRDHQIGEHYVFDNNIKLKKKDAGHLHFELDFLPADGFAGVQSRDIQLEGADQTYSPQRGHLKIHVVDGKKLKKMDTIGKSDPYMTFQLKDRYDDNKKPTHLAKTQVISNNLNPVWNQDLVLDVPDIKKDVLLVNLWDEDLKHDDRMMNEQEIPLSSVPIGQRQVFNDTIQLKKKDAGTLHYEYELCDGPAPVERSVPMQPCKLLVHAIKGEKLRKLDVNASDPYLTLQIKGEPDSLKRTKTIDNDLNPVWNETFEYHCKDWNTDVLVVNMMDEDIKHDDKMMNELEFPLRQWPIGTHIDYQEDIKLKKKDAGRLYLGIDVLDENAQAPPPQPQPEPKVQSRDIVLEEPAGDYCNFTLGNYPSDYSTDFTGYTNCSHSLSKLHSSEERFHHHHHLHSEVKTRDIQLEPKAQKVSESIKGTIIKANGIPLTDNDGSDTYVVLSVISKSGKDKKGDKVKTEVQRNTQDPVWNKEFEFPKAKKGDSLRAEIFQTIKLVPDQCIAVVEIALKDLKENEPVEQQFKLDKPPKCPKVLKKIVDFGTLTLSLTHNVQYK